MKYLDPLQSILYTVYFFSIKNKVKKKVKINLETPNIYNLKPVLHDFFQHNPQATQWFEQTNWKSQHKVESSLWYHDNFQKCQNLKNLN